MCGKQLTVAHEDDCLCVRLWLSFYICVAWCLCDLSPLPNAISCLPSTPILPSPSLSAAFKNALVSLSVRSLPSLAKPFRTNLAMDRKAEWMCVTEQYSAARSFDASFGVYMCVICVCLSHLSSSSSMKPLLSASSTVKTFFTSSEDLAFRPTISKNFLWSKESATAHTHTHTYTQMLKCFSTASI